MLRRFLLLSPALAACAGPAETLAPPPREGAYVLGSGDRLRLVVFGEEGLSGEHLVDPNGTVSVPLAGTVPAAGRTAPALAEEVTRRLRAGNFLRDPQVTVQVTETRPFYVLGEVQRPGEYRYRPGLTVNAAVAMAGGYTFRANQRRLAVMREGAGREARIAADSAFTVAPGDVLRVPERFL
jgi:polysaccharide export outer membrane protein